MNTDQKKDDLLRRLIPGPDGQSPVWLYPDGSHRCVTRFDVSDINAALAITRAQPVADDAGGDELEQGDYVLATKYGDGDPFDHWCVGFFDRKDGDRYHVNDDKGNPFRLGGFRRVEKISNEYGHFLVENKDRISTKTDKDQVVGSLWDSEISIRAALRQPAAADMINIVPVYDGMKLPKGAVINPDYTASIPAADNRGVDVEATMSINAIQKAAGVLYDQLQPYMNAKSLGHAPIFMAYSTIMEQTMDLRDIIRTTPEDAKGDEIERLKKIIAVQRDYLKAYQDGKYKLYSMSDEIRDAAIEHFPCGEGPLDHATRKALRTQPEHEGGG